jgi:hypothetical protein
MMRMRMLVPVLAFIAAACGPHHHPGMHQGHDGWAMHHDGAGWCGRDACTDAGRCFSGGALHLNAGACQQCTAGQWAAASGCTADGCGMGHDCDMKHCHGGDGKPCGGGRPEGRRHGPPKGAAPDGR